jgi:hypothetical protein
MADYDEYAADMYEVAKDEWRWWGCCQNGACEMPHTLQECMQIKLSKKKPWYCAKCFDASSKLKAISKDWDDTTTRTSSKGEKGETGEKGSKGSSKGSNMLISSLTDRVDALERDVVELHNCIKDLRGDRARDLSRSPRRARGSNVTLRPGGAYLS